MSERRTVQRAPIAVCMSGIHAEVIGAVEWAEQIKCPRGHWAWADGNYCQQCGIRLAVENTSDLGHFQSHEEERRG